VNRAVAGVRAAHVVDDDEAARPGDAQEFTGDAGADVLIRHRAEKGETIEMSKPASFQDGISAAGGRGLDERALQ
jgi:hypothetical protein